MAVSLKHSYAATGTNAGTGEVHKEEWNAEHALTLATARLLGRTTAGTGAAEEISVGTGLTLAAGTMSVAANTFQPLDGELSAIAGLVSAADRLPYFTGSGTAALATFTSFARTLLDDADATTARTTLGAGTVTSVAAGTGLTGGAITGSGTVAIDAATDADFRAGTANKVIAAGILYSANAPVTSSGTGSFAPDFNAGRVFARTMTGNSTLANPTNQVAGQSGVILMKEDATGGRTLSYGTNWKFPGSTPSITTTSGKVNVFSYYVEANGTVIATYLGSY